MDQREWRERLAPLLIESGMTSPIAAVVALTGGVSSDIVRVELEDRTIVCAKRALPKLKVAAVWEVPLQRNHYEAAWLRLANAIAPGFAPKVLAEDQSQGVVLLEYLAPDKFLLWKTELLAGRSDAATPQRVAVELGRVHAATWDDSSVAASFATDTLFEAIRISPYLRTLAERTPDLAREITRIADETANTRLALVHGDVSPKNILVSRRDGRPVLIDAECAWYGDPAFDAAFCVNHLFLKAAHLRPLRGALIDAAGLFFAQWLPMLPATARAAAERRAARLLPCLMLARIDGKSPVEYLREDMRAIIRRVSRPLIADAPVDANELLARFAKGLATQDPL